MKKYLKMFFVICICVSTLYYGAALAGDANYQEYKEMQNKNPDKNKPSQEVQQLTSEQTALVASILSKYNASSLTAEDAKAINNEFRASGIRKGPGQQEAIEAAGFDPKKISFLDPPPKMDRGHGSPERRESKSE